MSAIYLRGIAAAAVLLCGLVPSAVTQIFNPPGKKASFAVASIRPSAPDNIFGTYTVQRDEFRTRGMTLKQIVAFAYGIAYQDEVLGGPGWIRSDKFDISAKPDDSAAAALSKSSQDEIEEQTRLMVQSLLRERFGLQVTFALKELPGYELVIAKGGLKCPKVEADNDFAKLPKPRFQWTTMPPPPPPPPGWTPPPPGQLQSSQLMHIRTKTWPFWLLLTEISVQPELGGRPVVDKTGLHGNYDCEASWSPTASEGSGPSFFTALQDQIGLQLKRAKISTEVVVIKHVDHPTGN